LKKKGTGKRIGLAAEGGQARGAPIGEIKKASSINTLKVAQYTRTGAAGKEREG